MSQFGVRKQKRKKACPFPKIRLRSQPRQYKDNLPDFFTCQKVQQNRLNASRTYRRSRIEADTIKVYGRGKAQSFRQQMHSSQFFNNSLKININVQQNLDIKLASLIKDANQNINQENTKKLYSLKRLQYLKQLYHHNEKALENQKPQQKQEQSNVQYKFRKKIDSQLPLCNFRSTGIPISFKRGDSFKQNILPINLIQVQSIQYQLDSEMSLVIQRKFSAEQSLREIWDQLEKHQG